MKRIAWKVLLATLLLSGCSYDYPLKAVFLGGRLHFVGAESHWFSGKTGFCPNQVSVRSEDGQVVWQIETQGFVHPCELFPLEFGSEPGGWTTSVPAQALVSGQLYIITGSGGDQYHGAFRYEERRLVRVDNEPELAMDFPPYYGLEWDVSGSARIEHERITRHR